MLPGTERGSWFGNQRLPVKLALVSFVPAAFLLLLGAASLWSLYGAREDASALIGERLPRLDAAIAVERDTYEAMLNFTAYALSGDEAEYSGGRQSLARIKDAVSRLRVMAREKEPLGGETSGDPFPLIVDALFEEISRFDTLAEETRTLVQNKMRAWAAFNLALAETDNAFDMLRELAHPASGPGSAAPDATRNATRLGEDEQSYKNLITLQGDLHALRAAISTALVSESGMTLHSLGADFARHSSRLLTLWQKHRGSLLPGAEPGAEEGLPDLAGALGNGRTALASLAGDIEKSRELARERRNSAAAIAALARDLSRDGMAEMGGGMEKSRSSITVLLAVFSALLFFGVGGSFLLFYVFNKNMAVPLRDISDFARRAAEGDNTSILAFSRDDELGELAHTFRALAGAQRETMNRMQHKEREAEQQKRKASQIIERASGALKEAAKREEEIRTMLAALRERDASGLRGPGDPGGPGGVFFETLSADEFSPVSLNVPHVGPDVGAGAGCGSGPDGKGNAAGQHDASTAHAADNAAQTGSKTPETDLRDLARLSAGMRSLIRQLSEK